MLRFEIIYGNLQFLRSAKSSETLTLFLSHRVYGGWGCKLGNSGFMSAKHFREIIPKISNGGSDSEVVTIIERH